jgi:hypothetical protein
LLQDHVVETITLDHTVAKMISCLIISADALDTIVISDTIVAFIAVLSALLTSLLVM